jgi:hypothetical protein
MVADAPHATDKEAEMNKILRKLSVAAVLTALVAGILTNVASAAGKPNNPVISFGPPSPPSEATLTDGNVSFAFTYNRTPKQTSTLTCALSGPTSSSGACNAPIGFGSKGSESGESYTSLTNGSYTFTVSLVLTDGGIASATRAFTVNVPSGHIYWTNFGNASTPGSIGRANLDGTDVNHSFITGSTPVGVTVDSAHIYWSNWTTLTTLGRANLDGSGANHSFVAGALFPEGVAVDSGHVYWGNFFEGTIGRANLDGTDPDQDFITTGGGDGLGQLVLDSNHIYWADASGQIGRANLDGTGADPIFITGASNPRGVAVDGVHIYWANADTNTIGRANLDGTSVNQSFITVASLIRNLAVDSAHIYWANIVNGTIGRANLDGTGVNENFVTGGTRTIGLAIGTE